MVATDRCADPGTSIQWQAVCHTSFSALLDYHESAKSLGAQPRAVGTREGRQHRGEGLLDMRYIDHADLHSRLNRYIC